jgi:RNA polymerase sigma factor (sigma-70 family)
MPENLQSAISPDDQLDRLALPLGPTGAEQTDGQLLEELIGRRDARALEALVRRHAPMVWGVCRRALAHHDAEDAFQVTFLVLVRKASSIRSRELLPNWLYRVACQTARKARQRTAKRYAREKQVSVLPEPPMGPHDGALELDLSAPLDEELSRLPEKYRIAVVLCDVQGRTRHDAAQQLRLPEGTVASRLARGRALLAKQVAVSPGGRYALSGSSDQTVRLWRLPAPAPAPGL